MIGVGILFNGALDGFLSRYAGAIDHVSVIPERFWNDRGQGREPRFIPLPDEVATLESLASRHPLAAHGIGLSIGSASTFDVPHVRELAAWQRRYGFRWISEHLAAVRVRNASTVDHHAGLSLPLPWDREFLDLLCDRVSAVQEILGEQLLLENGVVHTPVPETEMTEVEFMNALCERTGCGILLDLHNLHVNAVNLGVDSEAFLDRLSLDSVREIHIAGGNELYGVYLDSHAGPCPERVFDLLERVLPSCPNLLGVTFEFHESYFPRMGDEGIHAQIARARGAVERIGSPQPCP